MRFLVNFAKKEVGVDGKSNWREREMVIKKKQNLKKKEGHRMNQYLKKKYRWTKKDLNCRR